jgi:DNA methyltransferase 1-associated protein 1
VLIQFGKNDKITRWVWHSFTHPARNDNLHLNHWQRREDVNKDYEYAQFNKKINLVEFTDNEYETLINDIDPYWTKEETLYLWDLCKQFDLRFIVIYDKYDTQYDRTVEELKDRYYSVSKKILEYRKCYNHPILKSGYNYEQEMKRRACLERIISRSKEESQMEYEMLKQACELEKKTEKFEKIENELKNLNEGGKNISSFEEYIKDHINDTDSFVYLRSQKLKHPLPTSEKIQKKVEVFLKELNIPDKLTPSQRVEQSFDCIRNSLIILTSLKKHSDKKEREKAKLTQTLTDLQNKNKSIINIPTGVMPDQDMLSISSSDKKSSLKHNRKRKANEEPLIETPKKRRKTLTSNK